MKNPIGSPSSTRETPKLEFPVDLQEQVRRRAYELYEQRGQEDGHDLEDWLQAESDVARQRAKAAGA